MLRRYKVKPDGVVYLNENPAVKKKLLVNKIISEMSGVLYILKGEPTDSITVRVMQGRIPRRLKVTRDGAILAKFYYGNRSVKHHLPVDYNPSFAQKLFSTFPTDEVVNCEDNILRFKGEPNLLAALVLSSNLREMPLDELIKDWSRTVKHIEELEGVDVVWSYD